MDRSTATKAKLKTARLREVMTKLDRQPRPVWIALEARLTPLEAEALDVILLALDGLLAKRLIFLRTDTDEEREACASAMAKVRNAIAANTEPFE